MKRLIIGIMGMLCMLICICGYRVNAEEASNTEDIADEISVTTESMGGNSFRLKLENGSDLEIRNIYIEVPKDNRLSFARVGVMSAKNILKSGDSYECSFTGLQLSASINSLINGICGYITPVIVIGFVIYVIVAYWLYKKLTKGKEYPYSDKISVNVVLWVLTLVGAMFVYISIEVITPCLNTLNDKGYYEGKHFVRDIEYTTEEGYGVNVKVHYWQDVIEKEVEVEDVEVPFGTSYEYDSEIPCTDSYTVVSEGEVGLKRVTKTTIFKNGEKDKVEKEEQTIQQPKKQHVIQGTKSVKELQPIEASRYYVPDDTMMVGEYELNTDISDLDEITGEKEVTYTWNEGKQKLESSAKVTKDRGKAIWRAGTLVVKEEVLDAKVTYVPDTTQEVGYRDVRKEAVNGSIVSIYKTVINPLTGKPEEGVELVYVKSTKTEPIDGTEVIGVLKTEEKVVKAEIEYIDNDSMWDAEEIVLEQPKDGLESVTNILQLDKSTGKVTNIVVGEASKEVLEESVKGVIERGTKEPQWIEEKSATTQVKYDTKYVADNTLKGSQQVVQKAGKNGRLIVTSLVAVDEEGNKLTMYKPKEVEEELVSPVTEVIKVAPDSELLK